MKKLDFFKVLLAAVIAAVILTGCGGGKDEAGEFTDKRDGQVYKTVKIGEQIWMAQNLNYAAEGSKCYEENADSCAKYGRLYDWETAKNAVPKGWHLPSNDEWINLTNFLGGKDIAGTKLKTESGWEEAGEFYEKDGNGTDEYGFSALPGGFGLDGNDGFDKVNMFGIWWSATEEDDSRAWSWTISCDDDVFGSYDIYNKQYLFSLRLVKDVAKEKKQKKEKQNKQDKQDNEETAEENDEEEDETAEFDFDWEKVSELKNSTIRQLKTKAKPEDIIIKEFFEKYTELCGEVGNALYAVYGNEWELCEKLYQDPVDKNLVKILKEMENNGMVLDQVEGNCFVDGNTDFKKKVLLPYVNSVSAEYLNLRFDANDYQEGGMFTNISATNTIDLVYRYGELSTKTDGLEYKDEVESRFNSYLGYLFSQTGEIPPCAWTWQEQDIEAGTPGYMYFPGYVTEAINEVMEKHPSSRAAKALKPYMAALKKMNYRDTTGDYGWGGKFYDYVAVERGEKFLDTRDGQFYKMVKIGEQVWMGENLNYAADGSKCYNNNPDSCAKYGRLYDYETAQNVVPDGWHLPTSEEWEELIEFAFGKTIAGKRLKSQNGWGDEAANGTDEYGFSALPGGAFLDNGSFDGGGRDGSWWCVKGGVLGYVMGGNGNYVEGIGEEFGGNHFLSVRCIKDK
jgi:uncharacterized protein (TIGR02145 family)